MNSNELLRMLVEMGAKVDPSHGKGGHMKVVLNGRVTFIPQHGKRELSVGLFHAICRQLGISPRDF